MCGVSRGFSWLATNVAGRAGGVRTTVGEGTGVSLGTGLAVGCRLANAVPMACVSAALISGVGADAWVAQAASDNGEQAQEQKEADCFLH